MDSWFTHGDNIMSRQTHPIAYNVASVKLLSPFRYPGGKTWLVPFMYQWLARIKPKPIEFIEPFAGGGIVGLHVAFKSLADHVTLAELDEDVASVWHTMIYGDAERLAVRIATFDLTPDAVAKELSKMPQSAEERAFQTLLKNRVARGGILAAGAGVLRHGEHGKGIKSRWYPETLKKRVLEIAKIRERITFIRGDGLQVMKQYAHREDVVFFIDPPYTVGGKQPGKRLYNHNEIDHETLFELTSVLTGDFLMTYINDERVCQLVQQYKLDMHEITMKNNHHARMTELLIGRDLSWGWER
jgi:DNA adenine methylase